LAERYGVSVADGLVTTLVAAWAAEELDTGEVLQFPALAPPSPARAQDWMTFVRGWLAVTYTPVGSSSDAEAFRAFLRQRYRRLHDFTSAWGLQGTGRPQSFDRVELPVTLPADGVPLHDWIQFVSAVLPIRRSAHRFNVLVPVRLEESDADREQRLGRVRRVVEADRPGHTAFAVKPYWAALRVGEARVGYETIVGQGSRYAQMVLGANRLGYAYLPGGAAWRVAGRHVVGRDRTGSADATVAANTGGIE
jgi:hypothetical protein